MTLRGQCPSCYTQHELQESDLGHVLECVCGVVSLACNASSFSTLVFICHDCKKKIRLRTSGRQKEVQCACGLMIPVPSVVLQRSVRVYESDDELKNKLRRLDEVPDSAPENVLRKSDSAHLSLESLINLKEEVQNDHAAGNLLEIVKTESEESVNAPSGGKRPKTVSVGSWLSILGVSLFFIYSLVLFLNRDVDPSLRKEKVAPNRESLTVGASASQESGSNREKNGSETGSDRQFAALPVATLPEIPSGQSSNAIKLSSTETKKTTEQNPADQLVLPRPTPYLLPKARVARDRVTVLEAELTTRSLSRAIDLAFEAYQETQELMPQPGTKLTGEKYESYQRSLGKTLGFIHQVHQMAILRQDLESINTMRYLLAYLSFSGGQLPEAMIYGESVARWGKVEDSATFEAGMIALAAAQEACETQWAISEELGELAQMHEIVSLISERWPKEPQVQEMWMNAAYLYEAFNRPRRAISLYDKVDTKSELFGKSKISSGLIAWRLARNPEMDTSDTKAQNKATSNSQGLSNGESKITADARQRLVQGLKKVESSLGGDKDSPIHLTKTILDARLALAQIDFLSGKTRVAAEWLEDFFGKPIVELISVSASEKRDGKLSISEAQAKQVFDVLIAVSKQEGKLNQTQNLLSAMSEMSTVSDQKIGATTLGLLKEAIADINSELSNGVNARKYEQAAELTETVLGEISSVPTETLLWIGESWAQIGEGIRAKELRSDGCLRAAEIYQLAIQRIDFPSSSMPTVQARRVQLLRQAGRIEESLSILNELLTKTPNVIELQMQSAELLQMLATKSGQSDDFGAAIKGPSAFSPIWGWSRLVTTLHSMRWNENASEVHTYQFFKAQYHLAECRYLAAIGSSDPNALRMELASLERSLKTIVATLADDNQWKTHFLKLLQTIKNP